MEQSENDGGKVGEKIYVVLVTESEVRTEL